jgi:hypothetical protein
MKVPRIDGQTGKGKCWTIDPTLIPEFEAQYPALFGQQPATQSNHVGGDALDSDQEQAHDVPITSSLHRSILAQPPDPSYHQRQQPNFVSSNTVDPPSFRFGPLRKNQF